jgi:hypothetical protein
MTFNQPKPPKYGLFQKGLLTPGFLAAFSISTPTAN